MEVDHSPTYGTSAVCLLTELDNDIVSGFPTTYFLRKFSHKCWKGEKCLVPLECTQSGKSSPYILLGSGHAQHSLWPKVGHEVYMEECWYLEQ